MPFAHHLSPAQIRALQNKLRANNHLPGYLDNQINGDQNVLTFTIDF